MKLEGRNPRTGTCARNLQLQDQWGTQRDVHEPQSTLQTTITKIVFALAMSSSRRRDEIRLQMLEKQGENLMVVTFSDNVLGTQKMPHVPCTFSVPQGQKAIAAQVTIEMKNHPNAKLVVVLDYYWLHLGYYKRYGLCEWFKSGFHRVLKAGADWVLFPNDAGTMNSEKKDVRSPGCWDT